MQCPCNVSSRLHYSILGLILTTVHYIVLGASELTQRVSEHTVVLPLKFLSIYVV